MSQYETYLSPFSWRYAGEEMRALWSEAARRRLWRSIWVALARAQSEVGLVQPAQVVELEAHAGEINIQRALEFEAELHHDLMAEVRTYAEQCPTAGGIIHLGATSMDIEDNADALRLRQSLDLLLIQTDRLLRMFALKMRTYAATPVMAFTHLQPAEPSTLGYRLASYAQDLLADREEMLRSRNQLKGKGFKGAVGTAASYIELLGQDGYAKFENRLSQILDLPFYPVSTQTYPRKQEYTLLTALAGLGATLYKFAFDLRLMQSPVIGEWSEPFGSKQVGSSAMPFKRNPIHSEKIDSLARALAGMPQTAWHNAAHSLLERTLDDSANRRTLLPEAFLISDELVRTAQRLVAGLNINEDAIARNLAIYAPFASTERLLMALVKAGANRQEMHEQLRDHAMRAWESVRAGKSNPLASNIAVDPVFQQYLGNDEIHLLLQIEGYTGIATDRAIRTAEQILLVIGAE
jgi:adenylosuccinate lyase